LTESTLQTVLQNFLGNKLNIFVVKCLISQEIWSGTFIINVIFYKYIQRSRLVKSKRLLMLIATGMLKSQKPLTYLRYAQNFEITINVQTKVAEVLKQTFGKVFKVNFHNMHKLVLQYDEKFFKNIFKAADVFMYKLQLSNENKAKVWNQNWVEKRLVNILILGNSFYRFKGFNKMTYFLDILLIILYASIYITSNLVADLIVRGLLRNMKRHKQFLTLIEITLNFYRSLDWEFHPLDWYIALNGKIGSGSARARTHLIKTGFIIIQTIDDQVNFAYRQVDTKFGSIGVKVWISK